MRGGASSPWAQVTPTGMHAPRWTCRGAKYLAIPFHSPPVALLVCHVSFASAGAGCACSWSCRTGRSVTGPSGRRIHPPPPPNQNGQSVDFTTVGRCASMSAISAS